MELDELFDNVIRDGLGLVEIFSHPPVDSQDPMTSISGHMESVQVKKRRIDEMWEEAWNSNKGREKKNPMDQSQGPNCNGNQATPSGDDYVINGVKVDTLASKLSPLSPTPAESGARGTVVESPIGTRVSRVEKPMQVEVVNQSDSDKFSELEEEAYEVCMMGVVCCNACHLYCVMGVGSLNELKYIEGGHSSKVMSTVTSHAHLITCTFTPHVHVIYSTCTCGSN